jgi:hypothetical protein
VGVVLQATRRPVTKKIARIAVPFTLVAAFAVAAVSQASSDGGELVPSWANANVCSATQFGVRAQIAGDGSAGDLQARFSVQWSSPGGWVPIGGVSGSPWLSAGSAEYTWQQVGYTFSLAPPVAGQSYQVRGVAELKWPSGRTESRVTGSCSIAG